MKKDSPFRERILGSRLQLWWGERHRAGVELVPKTRNRKNVQKTANYAENRFFDQKNVPDRKIMDFEFIFQKKFPSQIPVFPNW